MARQISEKQLTPKNGQADERYHQDVFLLRERGTWMQAMMTLLDMADGELTHITREY